MSSRWRERLTRTFGSRLALWYFVLFAVSVGVVLGLAYALLAASLRARDREIVESTLGPYRRLVTRRPDGEGDITVTSFYDSPRQVSADGTIAFAARSPETSITRISSALQPPAYQAVYARPARRGQPPRLPGRGRKARFRAQSRFPRAAGGGRAYGEGSLQWRPA